MLTKSEKLAYIENRWSNCERCILHENRTLPVFGCGNPDAPFLIVGEAPGANEDKEGIPFVGSSGQLLDQILSAVSVNPELQSIVKGNYKEYSPETVRNILMNDFFYMNIVACRPPENRTPTPKEMHACKPRLQDMIYIIDPVLIIAVGGTALEGLIGKKLGITSARGEIYEMSIKGHSIEFSYPVLAVLHPSYLLRMNDFKQKGGAADKTWKDFLKAMRLMDKFMFMHYDIPYPIEREKLDK